MGHDIFNASATATWLECSWSALNAIPEAPRKASTIAAAEAGTEQHAEMEAGSFEIVEEFLEKLEDPTSTAREQRVRIADNCGGTLDIYSHGSWRDTRIVTVLDAKFGKWDVAAYYNKQLLTYAAALLNTMPDAQWWRLVIFQPNGLDDEDPFKQWIAHRSEIEAHRDRVLRAIADRSPPKPGPHCRWCNAFQVCPAMSNDANFVMGAMSRPPESLTTQELVRLLRLIRALGDIKPVYEDALLTHMKLGKIADGASLEPGRAWRAWNDPIQAAAVLYGKYGPTGVKAVTPKQAEKLGIDGKTYAAVAAHKPEAPLRVKY